MRLLSSSCLFPHYAYNAPKILHSDIMRISRAVVFTLPAIRVIPPPFVTIVSSRPPVNGEGAVCIVGEEDDGEPSTDGEGERDGTDDDAPVDVEGEGDNMVPPTGTQFTPSFLKPFLQLPYSGAKPSPGTSRGTTLAVEYSYMEHSTARVCLLVHKLD